MRNLVKSIIIIKLHLLAQHPQTYYYTPFSETFLIAVLFQNGVFFSSFFLGIFKKKVTYFSFLGIKKDALAEILARRLAEFLSSASVKF